MGYFHRAYRVGGRLALVVGTAMMRALTLWQPMAWAISDFTKRIENRPWKPWAGVTTIAIHAGMKYHREHAEQIWEAFGVEPPSRADLPRGAIVAVAEIVGCIDGEDENDPHHELAESPWFCGPYGWILDNVRRLPDPVPCLGALGLWGLGPEREAAVRCQL